MLGVFTADEMRRLDRRAITELRIPGTTLMENAGRGAAESIVAALPAFGAPRRGARVVVVCGKGGNGGDGFVVARWLKRRGALPSVLLAFSPAEIGGDARLKLEERLARDRADQRLRSARRRPRHSLGDVCGRWSASGSRGPGNDDPDLRRTQAWPGHVPGR